MAHAGSLTLESGPFEEWLELEMHRWMVLSRVLKDRLFALWKQGRIRGRLLTGRGQEAIPTAAALAIGAEVFMHHAPRHGRAPDTRHHSGDRAAPLLWQDDRSLWRARRRHPLRGVGAAQLSDGLPPARLISDRPLGSPSPA